VSSITCFYYWQHYLNLHYFTTLWLKTFGKTGNAKTLLQYLVQLLSKKIQYSYLGFDTKCYCIWFVCHIYSSLETQANLANNNYAFVQLSNIFLLTTSKSWYRRQKNSSYSVQQREKTTNYYRNYLTGGTNKH